MEEGAGEACEQIPSRGERQHLGEAEGDRESPFGAVDQSPSHTPALGLGIDRDTRFAENDKIAIDRSSAASQLGGGFLGRQFPSLVEQSQKALLACEIAAGHRGY